MKTRPSQRRFALNPVSGVRLVMLMGVFLAPLAGLMPTARAEEPPIDSMARRMQACAACHGREGRAASDGYYPRIAGKPQQYLFNQLVHFRERRRGYAPMTHMVKLLSDDYLQEIAAYFSQLDLPYSPPQPGPTTARGLSLGSELVQHGDKSRGIPACASCHGEKLAGVLPDVPGLLGLPRDYINAQLGAWKTGLRHAHAPDCMARVAGRMDAHDIAAVSMWLASQPVPSDSKPAPSHRLPDPTGAREECGGLADTQGRR